MKAMLFFSALLVPVLAFTQSQTVKGRIVNAVTQEGLPFVSVGVEGTMHGTASDMEGFFELRLPEEMLKKTVTFSAIGFQNVTMPAGELLSQDFIRISMAEQTYRIAEVDITAQSLVLFRIIRTAIRKIPDNYANGPLQVKFYYKEETKINDTGDKTREAIIDLYDRTGYGNVSVTDAWNNRGYRFVQARRNFEPWSFPDGQTGFDELLETDPVRLGNTVLNESLLADYDLTLAGVVPYNRDSVWVITYRMDNPTLAHSGDCYATRLEGKLYILMSNYAILRNECMVLSDRNNPQNRSLYTEGNARQQVSYRFVTSCSPLNGRFVASLFECDKTWINGKGEKVNCLQRASALEFSLTPKPIAGRTFFEDTPYAENFWKGFTGPE